MKYQIEKFVLNNDIRKIALASVISAVTAVLIVIPEYQILKTVDGQFWGNILRLLGNAIIIVIILLALINLVLYIFRKKEENIE